MHLILETYGCCSTMNDIFKYSSVTNSQTHLSNDARPKNSRGSLIVANLENCVWARMAKCICAHKNVLLVFISPSCEIKHQNNTQMSTKAVCLHSTYIILFLA